MATHVQSALIGAFVTMAIAVGMLLRRRRRRYLLFALLALGLSAWFVASFARMISGNSDLIRIEAAIAVLIPIAMLRLFSELVPLRGGQTQRVFRGATVTALFLSLGALTPVGTHPVAQWIIGLFIEIVVLYSSRAAVQEAKTTKASADHLRTRFFAIGTAVVTSIAVTAHLPWLDSSLLALSHLAMMLYIFFLSQIILRERLIDLNEFAGRMVILSILALLFAGVSAILVRIGNSPSSRLFNATVGVIVLLSLYEPLKNQLEQKGIELFFRERHLFLLTLERLQREMTHGVIEPSQMSAVVLDALYEGRRATHAAIYLLDPAGYGFDLEAFRGPAPQQRIDASTSPHLWHWVQRNQSPWLGEPGERDDGPASSLALELRQASADLLFPFVSGESVLGLLCIRDDRSPQPFSTTEIVGLGKVAETAATVVWNSRLAEALRERTRLAAVGAMAAGLAHEIRNPLGAIKGAAELLEPQRDEDAESREFLGVILEETKRLDHVVSQFLDYARPFRPKLEPTDLNLIIHKTVTLFQAQGGDQPAEFALDLYEALPELEADGEQLKQLLINLVRNAFDASDTPWVRIATRHRKAPERVVLTIEDRGEGIPDKDLREIFLPFFTTKTRGTGLGLAICQRIVQNHGGSITAQRNVDRGTRFVVELPVGPRPAPALLDSFIGKDPAPA